ncbi:acyl-CoA carboxylase epsilon subunit [Alloactinosynnema sp. L-07]|uniref:acyl-CoA carboxylase epsilon subunit n=1 Tax=Alloactinosynnema sp. L-07 TaxID=1653480 RepID=UPI0012F97F9B|nr:acyl-CoA carboxylase epsilon subunit [Alloactinosynnema sp. L-07]
MSTEPIVTPDTERGESALMGAEPILTSQACDEEVAALVAALAAVAPSTGDPPSPGPRWTLPKVLFRAPTAWDAP